MRGIIVIIIVRRPRTHQFVFSLYYQHSARNRNSFRTHRHASRFCPFEAPPPPLCFVWASFEPFLLLRQSKESRRFHIDIDCLSRPPDSSIYQTTPLMTFFPYWLSFPHKGGRTRNGGRTKAPRLTAATIEDDGNLPMDHPMRLRPVDNPVDLAQDHSRLR